MRNFRLTTPVLLLASLLLSGCADWERHMQSRLPTPAPALADKQITVAPTRSVYAVNFAEKTARASDDERNYLQNFLNNTITPENTTVMVEKPARGSDRLTRQRAEGLVVMLSRAGYHVHRFEPAAREEGRIQVAVDHLLAMAPNCPNWEYHKYHEFGSQPSPNFGCADRTNLAAMVANPRDLVSGDVPSLPSGHAPLYGESRYRVDFIRPLQDAGDIAGN